jgi:uncharacterized membrane protein
MSELDNGGSEYELRPPDPSEPTRPKPGEPGWVPPTPVIQKSEPAEEEVPVDPDVQQNRAVAILAYIFFLIPLIAAPHSKFARFHANQGLLLFITWFAVFILIITMNFGWGILGGMLVNIWILLAFFSCIFHLVPVVMLLGLIMLSIMGIIHAANGETNRLPVIGNWILIK